MNSPLRAVSDTQVIRPCWEIMGCAMVTCPAYGNRQASCWRLPHSGCGSHHPFFRPNRPESCFICPVFKLNAEAHPYGWNNFLAAEMAYMVAEAQKKAPLSEEIYLQVLKNMPHGILITDRANRICYVNEAAELITGLSGRDMVGKECREINSIPFRVDPDDKENVQRSKDFEIEEFEMSRADGKVIPIVRTSYPVKDEFGALLATAHLLEDITDRKDLEDDLRQSERSYRHLFEESKDMIFIHSRGSILKDVNQACVEMLGYGSKEELLSISSVERVYVNPLHRKVFQEQIDRYGFVKDFETSFRKKDGTHIYCLVSGAAVRDKDGRIIAYEAISKDITARMDGLRNLHQQHRELSLLHSVAVSMNITHELDETLLVALKRVLEALNLNAGAVFLINHEKSDFVLEVHQGFPEELVRSTSQILLHDQTLMKSLLKADRSLKPQPTFPPFKASLAGVGDNQAVELLCFLITAKETASGFIALEVPPNRQITGRDHRLLGSLGNLLGSAVQNTCLLRTIQQHREELRGLTARLFHSQEEERKRIALELHDEAGQALTGISFTLETIMKDMPSALVHIKENILEVKKQINRTYQEMRRLSHRLHPALLCHLGLEPALEYCLGRISQHDQLEIDFKMVGFEERLDPEIETVLYRISQEVISNTLKHSGARHFKLSIIKSFPNIIFLAEDDGVGFDQNRFIENRQALGLLGMRERAAMVGGRFFLRTAIGKGTRIRIEIPIKESSFYGQADYHSSGR